MSPAVLRRAADPVPTPLGTLDALHLATALLWRDSQEAAPEAGLVVLTHDAQLGTAATAMGFETRGS